MTDHHEDNQEDNQEDNHEDNHEDSHEQTGEQPGGNVHPPEHETEPANDPADHRWPVDITTEELDHAKARASIYVDGLSLLGFNPKTDGAEIAFFHHMHKNVEMKIFDKDCRLVWTTESPSDYPPGSTLKAEITINTTQTGMGRILSTGTNEDFGHLPALAKWFGVAGLKVKPDRGNKFLSARLNIHNADFYTHQMSHSEAVKFTFKDDELVKEENLGLLGRILGADVLCQPDENLEIELKAADGTLVKVPPLTSAGAPYQIVVRTRPREDMGPMSHLSLVHDVLETPGGLRFEFKFEKEEPLFLICGEPHPGEPIATQFECQIIVDSEGGW